MLGRPSPGGRPPHYFAISSACVRLPRQTGWCSILRRNKARARTQRVVSSADSHSPRRRKHPSPTGCCYHRRRIAAAAIILVDRPSAMDNAPMADDRCSESGTIAQRAFVAAVKSAVLSHSQELNLQIASCVRRQMVGRSV